MATVITEEKPMTDEGYRAEFYRLLNEIDAIQAGFAAKDARIAQLRSETAALRQESARIAADISATIDRIAAMR